MSAPHASLPHRLAQGLLPLALALAPLGCGPRPEPAGRGLVLLPSEAPLARGVTRRDPRLFFHDFGRVPDGQRVAHVFQLRNEDPRDVSITRVVPGCGCSVAALRAVLQDGTVIPGESTASKAERLLTVPPGALAEVEVSVDTSHVASKNVDKLVTIGITTDSPNGYFLNLEVHILVERAFYAVPESLQLGQVPENGGASGSVDLVLAPGFEDTIVGLEPVPEGLRAELRREARPLGELTVLEVRLEPPLARGALRKTLRIATADAEGRPGAGIEVPVLASVVPDLITEPARLVLIGSRAAPFSARVELASLLAGQRLRVAGLELAEPEREGWLRARCEPLEPDAAGRSERWMLELTASELPADLETPLGGNLIVRLDDPQHPRLEVGYAVHVR